MSKAKCTTFIMKDETAFTHYWIYRVWHNWTSDFEESWKTSVYDSINQDVKDGATIEAVYEETEMTYEEIMQYAKEHYNHGGDGVYECYDENTIKKMKEDYDQIYTPIYLLHSFEQDLAVEQDRFF